MANQLGCILEKQACEGNDCDDDQALTDVIWLIGIDRRLGAQLASSLCPEPSVPINQMTPAFNIWGYLAG
ncbi:hypothetical protein TYRP_001236 [Tyrophagus putrescentiae]|nr:hypothetical protein TYRP_001236 [Tyrophagus putrescentiae]